MGTLQTTIKLNDEFSSQLKKINSSIERTAAAMGRLQQSQLTSSQLIRIEQMKLATAKQQTRVQVEKTLQSENKIALIEEKRKLHAEQMAGKIELQNRALQSQQSKYQGIFGQLQTWASRLRNILTMYYSIRGVVQGIGKAIKLSDKMTMTDAKLNLVSGGDKKLKNELEAKTFAAAQRSTTDYLEFNKAVGKLGILAGDKFKNNDSIVRFVELMNKSFQISGAETSERNAAMLQITQAIASNRLQGDEFRSILENAPMVMQALTKSLGVGHDQLKKMAKEGKITADVLIKAMFDAGTKIEEMYKQLPMTWERHWQKLKNVGVMAFKPIHEQFNRLFNSDKFQKFINGLGTAMIVLGNLAGWAFGKLLDLVGKVVDGFAKLINWVKNATGVFGILKDMIVALTFATAIYGVVWAIVNWRTTLAIMGALLLIKAFFWLGKVVLILSAILGTVVLVWYLIANAEKLATKWAAIWGVITGNKALLIIAVIALVIYIIYKMSDSWADAIGKIVGVTFQAVAVIWNIIYGVISAILQFFLVFVNSFIDGWEFALNCVNGGFDNFGNKCKNLLGQIISWFLNLGKVVTTIVDAIFGTNWTAGLESLQKNLLSWGKNKNAITLKRYEASEVLGNLGMNRWAYSDAYDKGYDWGSDGVKKVSGEFSKLTKGMSDLEGKLNDLTKAELGGQKVTADALNGIEDKLGDVGGNTGDTAKNTGETAKNTSSSNDYSYLRDWSYARGMGSSIGYNIKIEQNNQNKIGNNMDLNRVIDAVRDAIIEGIYNGAEGVRG